MWHPHRTLLYTESSSCKPVPRNTDVALSQGLVRYSESYKCGQVQEY